MAIATRPARRSMRRPDVIYVAGPAPMEYTICTVVALLAVLSVRINATATG
jgi:hypothetical protein